MGAEFEMYAMRGLVGVLGAAVLGLVGLIWNLFTGRLRDQQKELLQQRAEFKASIDSLNATIANLAIELERMNGAHTKEFATKNELRDVKDELKETIRNCREDCPEMTCHR